jgi:starvation-inducible DNA-binding protein
LYEEVYSSVDLIAELIRTLDVKVIASYTSFKNTTSIQEVDMIPADARNMFMDLSRDNDTVILALLQAYRTAETMGEIGISNVLQDRLTAHQKHGWMIKSILK